VQPTESKSQWLEVQSRVVPAPNKTIVMTMNRQTVAKRVRLSGSSNLLGDPFWSLALHFGKNCFDGRLIRKWTTESNALSNSKRRSLPKRIGFSIRSL
jgi:hypothetical protein